jgi:hypothetical protein
MSRNESAVAVIAALQANGGMFIDDHRKGRDGESKAQMFGIYKEQGKEHAFIGYTNSLFCINKCYIDEAGKVHLSEWSVGGNVRIDRFKGDVEGAILQFNEDCAKYNSFDKEARISEWHLNKAA